MTAPAARLLAAADLLDKRASEATKGPWNIPTGPRYVFLDGFSGHDVDGPNGGFIARGTRWVDGTYIALMHPEVGKAQAAMLRVLGSVDYPEVRMGVSVHTQKVFDAALALADLLLAGSS